MDLNKKLPKYLTDKQNIVRLIFFTAAFALLFINLYSPFGVEAWFNISTLRLFVYSSGVILTGVLVVAVSRIIMFQAVRRGMELRIYQYLIWVAAEIISMAFFYTFYELVILEDARPFNDIFRVSILNTSLTLLLPYSVLWLYFSWRDKQRQLMEMREQPDAPSQKTMIPLRDEKGTLRLSLKRSDILYLQGTDNYVTVWYLSKERLLKYLLRNTLKKMEDELLPESIIRCHRSYMVNMDRIKLIRREKEGLMLELDTPLTVLIPVSRTYMNQVLLAFGQGE
ncbi:MAG TPA: LytTR family DNA-binding domain-containing protein [Bacteroidales bacterium]|nr:LytTR family DNA-binding domain-containing protein [Bacteroidales bacterium]